MATYLLRRLGEQFFDANGDILAGGYLYYYRSGTTTLQTTYSDADGTIANTNPIQLNSSGRLTVPVYLGSVYDYKEALANSSNVVVSPWPFDEIPKASAPSSATTGFEQLYTPWVSVTSASSPVTLGIGTVGSAYAADATSGNIVFNLPSAATTGIAGKGYWIKRVGAATPENSISVVPYGSETIDGGSVIYIPRDYSGIYVSSDGAQWLTLGHDPFPIGTLSWWTKATPPAGWLLRNGSSLSATTYPLLFDVIGYMFGGSGSTFYLPDDRGLFIRGRAAGSSNDPDRASRTDRGDGTVGDSVGTMQSHAVYAHQHFVLVNEAGGSGSTVAASTYARYAYDSGGDDDHKYRIMGTATVANVGLSSSYGGNETRPINRCYTPIIKAYLC